MLKNTKKNILVEPEDLVTAMTKAKKEKNNFILSQLMDLFIEFEAISEEGYIKIKNNSLIADYIKNTKGVFSEDNFITPNILALALSRAIYEYNHEMKKVIQKYLVALMDAKVKKEDPQVVINLILDDEKVANYIMKFTTFDDYIKDKQSTPIKETKQATQKVNNKSYVIM